MNGLVATLIKDERVGYFAGGVPLFTHSVQDQAGARVAACQLLALGLAKQKEVAEALSVNRTTLFRQQQKLVEEGVAGLVDKARGPKGAHKLTGEVLTQAQGCLNEGKSLRQTAGVVGLAKEQFVMP